MRTLRLTSLAILLVTLAAGASFAQGRQEGPDEQKLDKALERPGKSSDKIRVIVRYKPGAAARVKALMAGDVDRIRGEHRGIRAFAVEMRRGNLAKLCLRNPEVYGCSEDSPVHVTGQLPATAPPTDPVLLPTDPVPPTDPAPAPLADPLPYDVQHLRGTLGIQPWDNAYGVGIAIIDSGIAPSPDLTDRVTAFYDFTAGGVATAPSDDYGHGTHIAGLIAGDGTLSNGKYVGVASGAHLIGLKVLDALGQGYTTDVIAAIEFATVHKAELGIDVINLSLGHPIFEQPATDPLVQAVEQAAAAGIVVVASAGNFGYNPTTQQVGYAGITSPGNAPSALTVGSLRTKATLDRSDDEVSLFSSRGPTWYTSRIKPDIIAPGQALVAINTLSSTLYQNPLVHADVEPYIKLSGTSMAAAVASGVVALVIQANRLDEGPGTAPLTPNMVKAVLQYSAIHVPTEVTDPGIPAPIVEGAGGVNAAGAIALAAAIDPNVPVGDPWLDAAVIPTTTIGGIDYSWGQSVVWGDSIVWGDTVMWHRLVWSNSVVWGNDDSIVWGDTLNLTFGTNLVLDSFSVWSNSIVWGNDDSIVWGNDDSIVWGDIDESIVWGNDDSVVWGDDDSVVWGNTLTNLGL